MLLGSFLQNEGIYEALERGDYYRLKEKQLEETIYQYRLAYKHTVRASLSYMVKNDLVVRFERGVYGITESGKKKIGH